MPLIRVKPEDLAAAGVERVPRTVGRAGRAARCWRTAASWTWPTSIWCTGLPSRLLLDRPARPRGRTSRCTSAGWSPSEPGLYFVGLPFLYAASSSMIHGVGRDAGAHRAGHRRPGPRRPTGQRRQPAVRPAADFGVKDEPSRQYRSRGHPDRSRAHAIRARLTCGRRLSGQRSSTRPLRPGATPCPGASPIPPAHQPISGSEEPVPGQAMTAEQALPHARVADALEEAFASV